MNKFLAALSIPLLSSGLFKCQFLNVDKKNIDYSYQYNPGYVLHLNNIKDNQTINIDNYTYTFNYNDREETQDLASNYIPSESYFVNIEENEFDSSGDSFEYKVQKQLLLGTTGYTFVFYKNGYVKAATHDKDLPAYYYFKFNAEVADRLYNKAFTLVDAHRQEIIEKEMERKRYEEKISTFSIDEVLEAVKEMDPFKFTYAEMSPTEYIPSKTLEDDGTIKDLLLNATYTELNNSVRDDTTYRKTISFSEFMNDEQDREVWSYSFSLSENSYIVTISKRLMDKYERSYTKTVTYSIGRETTHAIFDKAIELYAVFAQEYKQVQAQVDNFSMYDLVNDVKKDETFTFSYRYTDYIINVTDDGGVAELLGNATYSKRDYYYHDYSSNDEEIHISQIRLDENKRTLVQYYCDIYLKDRVVSFSAMMEDAYQYYHYADKYYDMDEGSCVALFAKVKTLLNSQSNE